MTLANAINKATKATGSQPAKEGQFYIFPYKGYTIQFAQNGHSGEATNYYTKKNGSQDDLMTDYFAGTFHDNLTQAIRFVDQISQPV